MKTFTTPKGTELPLIQLKGKDYLMVAWRLVWLAESVERYAINTKILEHSPEASTVRAEVVIMDKEGVTIRTVSATKRETKEGFADHLEKAETGAIGRALAMLGYGTQFAIADLDEGTRLADSPLEAPASPAVRKTSSFKKPATTKAVEPPANGNGTGMVTPTSGWE